MPAVTLWTYYLSGFWGIPNDHCNCFKDHLYIHSGVSFDKWNIIETLQLKIWIQSCYLRWWSGIDFSTTYLSLRLDSFCQYICCRVTLLCVLGLSPGSRPGHARGSTQGMGVFGWTKNLHRFTTERTRANILRVEALSVTNKVLDPALMCVDTRREFLTVENQQNP